MRTLTPYPQLLGHKDRCSSGSGSSISSSSSRIVGFRV